MAKLLEGIPDDWGPKFEGPSGAVTRTYTGPNEISYTAPSHMAVVLLSAQPDRQIALNSDRKEIGFAPVGSLEIVPAGADIFARWTVPKENLLIAVEPQKMNRLAQLEFGTDIVDLHPPRLGFIDHKALVLSQLMKDEILRGQDINSIYLDSLLTVFTTYLLRTRSSIQARLTRPLQGGLAPKTWRTVNDYIQAYLSERVSIGELAELAGLSPSHFLRAFRQTTGQPPHLYILSCRLTRAWQLITTTDLPFSMIAKAVGFHSNSHMTATMRRAWGTTPTRLRRECS